MAHILSGEFGTDERFAILDSMGVEKAQQRTGLGAQLMQALRDEAGKRKCTEIRTQVEWEQQHLLSFFAHSGFVPAMVNVLERDLNQD